MLTVTEVGTRLGISPRRVLQLIAEGKLAAQQHGRVWLIDERALPRATQRRTEPGRPPK